MEAMFSNKSLSTVLTEVNKNSWTPEVTEASRRSVTTSSRQPLDPLYITISLTGIIGNILVLVVLLRYKHLRNQVASVYFINQSCLDLWSSFFLLLWKTTPQDNHSFDGVSGYFYCNFWTGHIPFWAGCLGSTWNLVVLTIERFIAITQPIRYKTIVSKTRAKISVLLIWSAMFLVQISLTLATSVTGNGECRHLYRWQSNGAKQVYIYFNFLSRFLLPCLIFFYCYVRMAWTLHIRKSMVAPINAVVSQNDAKTIKARDNVIKTLCIMVSAYILLTSCNQVCYMLILSNTLSFSFFRTDFFQFTVVSFYCICTINPIIYTIKYREFQKSAKKLFCGHAT